MLNRWIACNKITTAFHKVVVKTGGRAFERGQVNDCPEGKSKSWCKESARRRNY